MISEDFIQKCKNLVAEADRILIGAGSGLSTAAGINYGGTRFTDNFPDYIKKYGISDMYSAAFYPYSTLEEKWGYFSRHIKLNRYDVCATELYTKLLKLVENKEYFVITTNVDAQFEKAGFDVHKLFATQGDYGKFQCEKACHNTLYDNEEIVKKMVEQQQNCRIPSELIPKCPVCGENLDAHLRKDNSFVENADWHAASLRYKEFVQNARTKKLVMLELGIGFNTPGIIRYPFEQLSAEYANSCLIRVNMDNVDAHYQVGQNSILLKADIAKFVQKVCI